MARRIRIAALGSLAASVVLVVVLAGAYFAARQVRPFYEQALRIEPEELQRGSRELESRATALYSDARQHGQWHALFTAEQINGWLAIQLAENQGSKLPTNLRDPRVAIASNLLTLGFRTTSGGVDTVISVDASVFLTDEGAVAIRLMSVRAGALPLPVLPLADEIAAACKELSLPVRWTQQDGLPVAVVEIHSDPSTEKRQFYIDSIELAEGELYVAGHTEIAMSAGPSSPRIAGPRATAAQEIKMTDYELQLTPNDDRSALKIARRPNTKSSKKNKTLKR
ncbi:MAG: hypothetical protein WD738_20315 [Pirellulales bacterium]